MTNLENTILSSSKLLEFLSSVDIHTFVGVPDSIFKELIEQVLSNQNLTYIPAVREDIAIGIATGMYLTGHKSIVFMENSGLGTSLDAIASLTLVYKISLPMIIAWAGFEGKDVPHHNIMGLRTTQLLRNFDIPFLELPVNQDDALNALGVFFQNISKKELGKPYAILVKSEGFL